MSETKTERTAKRQLGQYLTPPPIAAALVKTLELTPETRILEPSMGDGSFLIPLIERFLDFYTGPIEARLTEVLTRNVWGVEIDPAMFAACLDAIRARWNFLPTTHNLVCTDFFRWQSDPQFFDWIVGNPPFGGTIEPEIQDALDRKYGWRNGLKIKKETYSFFIVKSLELLKPGGRITFICSDTFLTISTMRGLRRLLMNEGKAAIETLDGLFDETKHPMVVLDFRQGKASNSVELFGEAIPCAEIEATGNLSWTVTAEYTRYFSGPKLGDYCIASSGMTIGANELFLRPIEYNGEGGGKIREPFHFEFFDDLITLENERGKARLGKISPAKARDILRQEAACQTRRNVRIIPQNEAEIIELPHPDYRYYNKSANPILYAPPNCAIFWKDAGDAALTFKKNGNWYLHGVGGAKFFGREGITWQLIASRLTPRYLPPGYILDSGSPCAFLRDGVNADELYFILGWLLSPLCNRILKAVINHTRNIQSKDVERLPYPSWIDADEKNALIQQVKQLLNAAQNGVKFHFCRPEIEALGRRYEW